MKKIQLCCLVALFVGGCVGVYQKKFEKEERAIKEQEVKIESMEGDSAPDIDIHVEKVKLDKMKDQHEKTRDRVSEEQARRQALMVAVLNGGLVIFSALAGKAT